MFKHFIKQGDLIQWFYNSNFAINIYKFIWNDIIMYLNVVNS
jgi:hypothetical protein